MQLLGGSGAPGRNGRKREPGNRVPRALTKAVYFTRDGVIDMGKRFFPAEPPCWLNDDSTTGRACRIGPVLFAFAGVRGHWRRARFPLSPSPPVRKLARGRTGERAVPGAREARYYAESATSFTAPMLKQTQTIPASPAFALVCVVPSYTAHKETEPRSNLTAGNNFARRQSRTHAAGRRDTPEKIGTPAWPARTWSGRAAETLNGRAKTRPGRRARRRRADYSPAGFSW